MIGWKPFLRARAPKRLAAAVAALALLAIALPVWAADPLAVPEFPTPEPVLNSPLHRDAAAPAHHLKLEVPRALIGEQSAEAPKLSIELGYGGAPPLDSAARLPGPWGHTDLRAIKAGVSLGF